MAYITLNEAAELEEIEYETIKKRVQRTPEKYDSKEILGENGGRNIVMISVSSLSRKAQSAFKEREKLKELANYSGSEEQNNQTEVPWYVNEDVEWYIDNRKKDWYRAMELGNIVREFLEYEEKGRTDFAETFAQERLGKGKRTLYRYTKAYQEAAAWADKMNKQDGGNYDFFKVLCLCRKPKEAGTFPSFTPEVKQCIKNIWFNKEFAQNQGTREMLYTKLQAVASINNWQKIPSYQSVTRYINYLMEDENLKNAWYLASRGEREYKNKVMVKGERNTKDGGMPACIYCWFSILAILAFMKKYGNLENKVSRWMSKKSWGIYVFHYLPLACVAYYLRCFISELPAGIVYIVVGISAFAGALFLYEIISRIPIIRWCVLGVKKEKKHV